MSHRRTPDRSELNLLPMMNLVSLLIPLLLMGSQFVLLSTVQVSVPAVAPSTTPAVPDDMRLVVHIEPTGFEIHGAETVFGVDVVELPCPRDCVGSADWPTEALTERLAEVKAAYPSLARVVVVPDSKVAYQTIIKTLDASREHQVSGVSEELFPMVQIAAR